MAFKAEIQVNGRLTVMSGQIKFLENLEKEHDQVNDGGDHTDTPDFVKDRVLNEK